MTELEKRDLRALGRSCLILTGLALLPVPLLMALLGPVLGLIALALAIPLSAHLGDLVSFGETPQRAWDRVREEARRVGQVTGLSAALWIIQRARKTPQLQWGDVRLRAGARVTDPDNFQYSV